MSRFEKGDVIEVTTKSTADASPHVLAVGKALDERGFTGFATFSVLTRDGRRKDFNLNEVDTKVIFPNPDKIKWVEEDELQRDLRAALTNLGMPDQYTDEDLTAIAKDLLVKWGKR